MPGPSSPTPEPGDERQTPQTPREARARVDRDILRLAIPSLGALIAQPLFVLVDSAFVARVGTVSLAGLGLASVVLTTVVALSVFLAYSTTAAVSRAFGAGRRAEAIARGVDACWLALGIGTLSCLLLLGAGDPLLDLFGPSAEVLAEARTYLHISTFGLPAMLAVQAATGLVRGLQKAMIPLVVAGIGAAVNVPLNWFLIFGLDLGIAGSAIGTIIAEWGMAIALLTVVARCARRNGVSLRPQLKQVASAGRDSVPMFVRTLTLRVVLLVSTFVATDLGAVQLAAHQLALTLFNLFALALDALAIAGQALVGKYLGASDTRTVRAVTSRLVSWGVGGGLVTAALLLAVSYLAPAVFTPDAAVQENLRAALWVLIIAQPIAGYVFVLDGVLMGAGDAPYLAKVGVITMLATMPGAAWVAFSDLPDIWALAGVWISCTLVFMIARAITLGLRVRGDAWMRLGA
ncbi:putative MATE family efflux protein [Brachybacterium muris]|nr:MATE family efflux transporter [Brachybacterium muris]MBM7499255.1 putative MATE family efflux protein [Brachybacterium muris]MCT1431320.1 MATE family efflux transporter [Brachybacterium muris]MCT2260662.1 MATE family efflux transporter [Brachybacterium muris]